MKNRNIKKLKSKLIGNHFSKKLLTQFNKNNIHFLDGLDEKYLSLGKKVEMEWPNNKKKPKVGVVKDYHNLKKVPISAYWPKFIRFLKNNNIPYDFFKAHENDWMDQAKDFNLILWRPTSDPVTIEEALMKIYLLENKLDKICFPHYKDMWFYENKIKVHYLLALNEFPTPDTFISFSRKEAIDFAKICNYPLVSKVCTSSGSAGVELIENKKQALSYISKVFGEGRETYWNFRRQKDYVFFQEFIKNAQYDLRVIIVGDLYFGYYRYPKNNDFRASGSGKIGWKEIPKKALNLAKKVKESLKTTMLAVDMIPDGRKSFKIIEASIFFRVDDGIELAIDGVSGHYIQDNGEFIFREGQYWIPELLAKEAMKEYIDSKNSVDFK